MTHTTYIPTSKKNNNNGFAFFKSLFTPSKPKSATEKLDDLILSSLIKKNPYMADLNKPKDDAIIIELDNKTTSHAAKGIEKSIDFIGALDYLINSYKPDTEKYYGNYYTIEIGDTIITVFDDEIQINDVVLSIEDSKKFMNFLPKPTQKLIIDYVIDIKL